MRWGSRTATVDRPDHDTDHHGRHNGFHDIFDHYHNRHDHDRLAAPHRPLRRPGDLVAFERQIDEVYDFLGRFAAPREEVPFPDVTNPDPVVAFGDLISFRYWMLTNNPRREWVKLFALDETEYALNNRNRASQYGSVAANYFYEGDFFEFQGGVEIEIDTVEIPPSVEPDLVDSAVAVEFVSSSGDFYVAFRESMEVIEEFDGWSDLTSHAIVVPTGYGWRILYIDWET